MRYVPRSLVLGVVFGMGVVVVPGQAVARPHPAKVGDFNGDGRRDVAVGAPGVNGGRGAVVMHLGGPKKVSAKRTVIGRSTAGVPGAARKERFGERLASADFNGDGYADLAVGVPGRDTDGNRNGQVVVLRGSKKGLSGRGSVALTPGKGRRYVRFGNAMAVGDFNVDGYPDLAVADDNRVRVFRGGAKGLSWKRSAELTNGQRGFGRFLASGDVDGDRVTDLVVVSDTVLPGGTGSGYSQDGRITVVPGHRGDGLRIGRSWFKSVKGREPRSLSVGDVTGDGRADVVTSIQTPEVGWSVLFEPSKGKSLGYAEHHFEYRDPLNVILGDLTGDGRADLVVPGDEDRDRDRVRLFPGTRTGLGTTQGWTVVITTLGLSDLREPAFSIMNVSGGPRNELLIGDGRTTGKRGGLLVLHAGRAKQHQFLPSPWKPSAAYGAALVRKDAANLD